MTSTLNTLKSNSGSRKKKLRKGRGIAAGQGASCGFGMRGQKSRSGRPTRPGFEGGQMPLYRRLPKRGFNPIKSKNKFAIINLSKIQSLIEKKIISAETKIDLKFLKTNNLIKKNTTKFKILGTGEIKSKINLDTDLLSKSAKDKLSKSGSVFISKNNS